MKTDHEFRPLPWELDHFLDGFGDNIVHRYDRLADYPADESRLLWTIRNDLKHTGIQGLISLIRVLIAETLRARQELRRLGTKICGLGMAKAFCAILDLFEGRETGRHIWHRDEDGFYRLNDCHELS
ncbi:hypothetical protein GGQ88_000235 [Novosphingobium hassiacum]|uniref:Uncharacterized protein n=1 Tax=Novosphingobium hassiacum TaxID=173676 RepID=A0A7W6EUJ9_9SPHN|nr:hypothetical protein [Novosphingobium hassiacum]MBB3858995.1 hypothetical protein [Novosphingobium hassiacum]